MPKQNVAGFFIVLFCGGCATWDPPANQPSGIAIGIQEIADPEDPTSEGLIPDKKKESDQPLGLETLHRKINELLDLINEPY